MLRPTPASRYARPGASFLSSVAVPMPLLPVMSAQGGDAEKSASVPPDWDAIVRLHGHRVLVLLLAMGIRVDRAREIAQTTWMRLLEQHRDGKLDRLDFPGLALAQAR